MQTNRTSKAHSKKPMESIRNGVDNADTYIDAMRVPQRINDRFNKKKIKSSVLGFDKNSFPMIRDEKEERYAQSFSERKMDFIDNGNRTREKFNNTTRSGVS